MAHELALIEKEIYRCESILFTISLNAVEYNHITTQLTYLKQRYYAALQADIVSKDVV